MTAATGITRSPDRGRRRRAGLLLTARILAAVIGGYFLSAALVALSAAGLAGLGMDRSEAVVLMAMLGFLIYLLVLIWAFAERSLPRMLAVTLGGAALAHALAHWLSMAPQAMS
jgi:hypothetical protein